MNGEVNQRSQRILELLSRAGQDSAALGELLELYRPYLKYLAIQHLDPKIRARCDFDDVVQQAMQYVSEHFAEFRGDEEPSFCKWITVILRNQLNDWHRKHVQAQQRTVLRESRLTNLDGSASISWCTFVSDSPQPIQNVISGETALSVAKLLASLSEEYATVVHLRYVDGLAFAEVASVMEITPRAAARILRKAVRALAEKIQDDPDFSSWIKEAATSLLSA